MALHALQNSLTFAAIKTDDLMPFAGIVVLGVGTVVAGATAVSVRSRVAA